MTNKMSLTNQVIQKITECINDEISSDDLHDFIVPLFWDQEKYSLQLQAIIGDVLLALQHLQDLAKFADSSDRKVFKEALRKAISMKTEVSKFRDLRDRLNALTEDQLDQKAQILYHDGDKLNSIVDVNTIANYEAENTHSAEDFKHHPEQVVLLCDSNPFDNDGNSSFTWKDTVCPKCHEEYTQEIGDLTGEDYSEHCCDQKERQLKFLVVVNFPDGKIISNQEIEKLFNENKRNAMISDLIGAEKMEFNLLFNRDKVV